MRKVFFLVLPVILIFLMVLFAIISSKTANSRVVENPGGIEEFYNISEIKNMGLEDLEWRELKEEVRGNLLIVEGEWCSGLFPTYDSKGGRVTIKLHHRAILFYPLSPVEGKGLVLAKHTEGNLKSKKSVKYARMAAYFKIPILIHGEKSLDWEALGWSGRNEMLQLTFFALMKNNREEVKDLVTGNFALALAKTNSMAITLLQRLCERQGNEIKDVALMGGSKEGYATWLASTMDERITVAGPGGFQFEDMVYGITKMEEDWGCENMFLPEGKLQPRDLIPFRDWMEETEAGREVYNALSIANLKDELKPMFFIISGDVGAYGLHDGRNYPIGVETPFLEEFKEKPWRYIRYMNRSDAIVKGPHKEASVLTTLLEGVEETIGKWPKVEEVISTTNGDYFKVKARVTGENTGVYLVWSHSNDTEWNDPDNAPWRKIGMHKVEDLYESHWLLRPENCEVGFYVEVERTFKVVGREIHQYDCSPVKFLYPLPPK